MPYLSRAQMLMLLGIGFVDRIDVMRSMQRPKKLSLIGTDGKTYAFLCKTNDDLRKDARLMEFSHMINRFLRHDSDARQRALCKHGMIYASIMQGY